jgi:hypothetical protein
MGPNSSHACQVKLIHWDSNSEIPWVFFVVLNPSALVEFVKKNGKED